MARLFPNDYGTATLSAGEAAELETLETLRADLPDDYTVFHGVHWADEDRRGSAVGELDFVVVNQAGAILLVEQKAGSLEEGGEGLVKRYGDSAQRRRPGQPRHQPRPGQVCRHPSRRAYRPRRHRR